MQVTTNPLTGNVVHLIQRTSGETDYHETLGSELEIHAQYLNDHYVAWFKSGKIVLTLAAGDTLQKSLDNLAEMMEDHEDSTLPSGQPRFISPDLNSLTSEEHRIETIENPLTGNRIVIERFYDTILQFWEHLPCGGTIHSESDIDGDYSATLKYGDREVASVSGYSSMEAALRELEWKLRSGKSPVCLEKSDVKFRTWPRLAPD